jgi:hypothetical protein
VRAVPSTITPTSLRAALRAGYTAAQRRQEDAADAWAAQVRRVIPDASLWRWIID